MDLFDYKPELNRLHGQELPDSVRQGSAADRNECSTNRACRWSDRRSSSLSMARAELDERIAAAHGQSCRRSLRHSSTMNTEAINHGPGVTMMQTGSQFPGRPSMGSWLWYGLG